MARGGQALGPDGVADHGSGRDQCRAERRSAVRAAVGVRDLDRQRGRGLGELIRGRGPQQLAAVDDDDMITGALQLTEEVGGHQDGDPEVGVDAADQAEHLVPADRVQTVGRLVQEHQLRVVHQRLGQLHPLLHTGRVAAHGAIALLVEADMTQGVRGPLAGGRRRQAGHPGHMHHELGGRDVRRQAVVLGHIADPLADGGTVLGHVQAEDVRAPFGGRGQAEKDLDQGGFSGTVGTHQARHAGPDVNGEPVQGGHPGEPLAQAFGHDHSHVFDGRGGAPSGRQPRRWSLPTPRVPLRYEEPLGVVMPGGDPASGSRHTTGRPAASGHSRPAP